MADDLHQARRVDRQPDPPRPTVKPQVGYGRGAATTATTALLAVGLVGLLVGTAAGLTVGWVAWNRPKIDAVATAPTTIASKGSPISRADFEKACKMKYAEHFVPIVGRPDRTEKNADGVDQWVYVGRTFDPVSGKPDELAVLTIKFADTCVGVTFR